MTHAHEHDSAGTRNAKEGNQPRGGRPRGRVQPGNPAPDPSAPTPTKPDALVSADKKLEEGRSEADLDEEIAGAESQLVGEVQQREGKTLESDEVNKALATGVAEAGEGDSDIDDAIDRRNPAGGPGRSSTSP